MRACTPALLFVLFVAPSARAQDDPVDAVAEALFRDGRALMTQRRYAEACAKLAESERLDPHIGTLLNLAACRVLEGRTATAWAEYQEARAQAARAGRTEREQFAVEQLRALEPRLARVVVAATHPPPGLVLTLDGQQLEAGAFGTALPVDPGAHQISATAPERASWSTTFEAREATTAAVHVPELAPLVPRLAVPTPTAAAPAPAPLEAPPSPPPSHATGPFVWVLGGAALVGIGVGAYFGVETFVRNGDANSACPREACSPAGLAADSDARNDAAVSNVAFVVAGVAAAGAVVLFAVGRASQSSHVAFVPGGLRWEGTW